MKCQCGKGVLRFGTTRWAEYQLDENDEIHEPYFDEDVEGKE